MLSPENVTLPDSETLPDETRLVDQMSWTVIPALPGTRIEWNAEWCKEGSLVVHAWLINIDVIGRRYEKIDTSCVNGIPMVMNSYGMLQNAHSADLEGTPGEVLEPR